MQQERLPLTFRTRTMSWETVKKKEGTTATDYSYDMANQLISVNGQAYSHDESGNLISNGKNTYHYNAENQLTSVQTSTGTTNAIYEYNQDIQSLVRFERLV